MITIAYTKRDARHAEKAVPNTSPQSYVRNLARTSCIHPKGYACGLTPPPSVCGI